jgi:hypothetical protein
LLPDHRPERHALESQDNNAETPGPGLVMLPLPSSRPDGDVRHPSPLGTLTLSSMMDPRQCLSPAAPLLPPPEDTQHGPAIHQEKAQAQEMDQAGAIPDNPGIQEKQTRDASAEAMQNERSNVDLCEKHPEVLHRLRHGGTRRTGHTRGHRSADDLESTPCGTLEPFHAMLAVPKRGVLKAGQLMEQVCQVKARGAFALVDAVIVRPFDVEGADRV